LGEGRRPVALVTDLDTLKLTYDRVREESRRLRDARAHFARGLGPAPTSAGIATAVTAAFGQQQNRGWLYAALALLALMVLVGMLYVRLPAYRQLYARRLRQDPGLAPGQLDQLRPEEWYERMIALERSLYGDQIEDRNRWLAPFATVDDLQTGADAERTGALAVQALWVGVMICLVVSQLG
jgi:hypothetical protein